jgi:high-affinity nickel-transport protein
MCLLDTTDGALMMALYTSTSLARDQIAVLYYSVVLTVITIIVAIVIGIIQVLFLVRNVTEPTGRFWDGVKVVEDYYDVIGGAICASFILFGGVSILLYKPWRRYIDHRRQSFIEPQRVGSAERDALLGEPLPGEEYEEGLEDETSLRRPEGENIQGI